MTQAALKKTFYSNGKLLITGEYTVLDGATALALPTIGGQTLEVESTTGNTIHWKSFDADGSVWFEAEFPVAAITDNTQNSDETTNKLIEVLHEAWLTKPDILETGSGYRVETKLTFPKHWGLGTSSTLINNIAQWFEIDAFALQSKTFGSSGYDIACAKNDTPILYHLDGGKPVTEKIDFEPAFADNIYFVYLNRKQNSRQAIAGYRERRNSIAPIITKVDILTQQTVLAESLKAFSSKLKEHETIMSGVLGIPTMKSLVFPDFDGTIKSLGAWGGDFVIATAIEDPTDYFKSKGFETVIGYRDMILRQKA